MIYFFTPYSFNKKLFEAYDAYMKLIPNAEDWGCIMDGDMAFLMSDFGHQIQEYIDKYPNTGMFVSYASRSPYGHQMETNVDCENDSIRYIYENTLRLREANNLKVIEQTKRVAGPILIIKKSTWLKYRDQIAAKSENANIQAIDTAISDTLQRNGEKVLLMAGLQVYHYFRHNNFSEKHILSDKLTVVIRTHDRPQMFKRAFESVRSQTHPNIDIVVSVDTPGTLDYVKDYNPTKIVVCTPRVRKSHNDFPANEYISKLVEEINDGFILILDDDNYIADPEGVEKLFKQIEKEWCIYIIRYRYPDGRLFPNDRLFASKIIQNGGIDWASHVFHARFKNVSKSLPLYNADYFWINNLVNYAKTTKWIDLALVHTETPGLDGKTETELKGRSGSTDVVYVLGKGSAWNNNEIKYSIRSFEKYFTDLRNIVIVGECPDFLTGIIHIPYADRPGINKDCRMMQKIKAACLDTRVSENFILCTDDTLILHPLSSIDFTGWHDGKIVYNTGLDAAEHRSLPEPVKVNSEWFDYVYATGTELTNRGLPDNNYDRAHCPQPVNKKEFVEIMQSWDMENNNYTISNIYNNSTKLFEGQNIKGKNLKVYAPVMLHELITKAEDKICFNYNDNGLTPALKDFLQQKFPVRSGFEKYYSGDNRRMAVEEWFKNGSDYNEGVKIFSMFAPKNFRLKKYFETKQNDKFSEYKLKKTLELWLH